MRLIEFIAFPERLDKYRRRSRRLMSSWTTCGCTRYAGAGLAGVNPAIRVPSSVHGSTWMNQVEQSFGILTRKRLRIVDFGSEQEPAERKPVFIAEGGTIVHAFDWSDTSAAKTMAKFKAECHKSLHPTSAALGIPIPRSWGLYQDMYGCEFVNYRYGMLYGSDANSETCRCCGLTSVVNGSKALGFCWDTGKCLTFASPRDLLQMPIYVSWINRGTLRRTIANGECAYAHTTHTPDAMRSPATVLLYVQVRH